ncbi:unnamed protein product [Closterium sp. Yama58-4]|nr:unnamed protein product [Closterium sp. Yama58-4]
MLEFAAVELEIEGFYETSSYSTYLRPPEGVRISRRTVEINGITSDTVRNAPSFGEVADRIYELMDDPVTVVLRVSPLRARLGGPPGKVWAGHNIIRFDNARIREAFGSLGRVPPEPAGVVDTYDLLRREFGTRAGDMKVRGAAVPCGWDVKEKHSESILFGKGEGREGGEAQGEGGSEVQQAATRTAQQAGVGECVVSPGWWQQQQEQHTKEGAPWAIACAHFDPFWLQAVCAPAAGAGGTGGNGSSRGSGWGGGRRYSLRGGSARVYPNGFRPQPPSDAADAVGGAVEGAPARVLLLYNGRSLHVRECGARIKMRPVVLHPSRPLLPSQPLSYVLLTSVSDRFAFDEATGRPSFSLLLAVSPAAAAAITACFDALLACVGSGSSSGGSSKEAAAAGAEGGGEGERSGERSEEVRSPFVAAWEEEDGKRVIRVKLAADGVRGNAEWRTKVFSCVAPHTTALNPAIVSTSSPTGATSNDSSQQSPASQQLHTVDPHQLHLPVDPYMVAAALPAGAVVDVAFLVDSYCVNGTRGLRFVADVIVVRG